IESTEAWSKRAYPLVAIDLQIKNFHCQCVAGFRAFDVERTRKRVVALDHAEGVTSFFQDVSERIERVSLKNVPWLQPSNRSCGCVDILHVLDAGVILHCLGSLRDVERREQRKYEQEK